MTLIIESPRIYTSLGVPITVTGVAQVKIQGSNSTMLSAACEMFLGKSEAEVQDIARETLEGHQRAIMGNMTVEEIYQARKKFSNSVFKVASSDLVNMGISVVSYTLKDVQDDEGYLTALGLARTAQVKKDARIGEAEARKDAGIKSAIAEQERAQAKLANDIEVAKAKRDYELKKASYDMEVQTTKAISDKSYDLQAAKTRQLIKEEEMQIQVVERKQQIQVEQLEIQRKKRQLDATVRKKAEAERYSIERIAEAEKMKLITEAEAEAESVRLRGQAEAAAMQARARAEGEQMAKKAEAWQKYQGAARLEMILETVPKLAAEISAPLNNCKKMTVVSNGEGDLGVVKLTSEVMEVMSMLPKVIENMTGINMVETMQSGN